MLRKTKNITIDAETKTGFQHVLKLFEQEKKNYIKPGTYFYRDEKKTYCIQLNHSILKRQRKKSAIDFRYEFLNPERINYGGTSEIFSVKGTLSLDDPEHPLFRDKKRVVKIQSNYHQKIQKEYELTLKAGHYSIKPIVYQINAKDETISFLVMENLEIDLYELLKKDLLLRWEGKKLFTGEQRLELIYKLLVALKEQIIDKGILHRDLKPENIMVKLEPEIKVYIVDFGWSGEISKPECDIFSTPQWLPPEKLKIYDNPQYKLSLFRWLPANELKKRTDFLKTLDTSACDIEQLGQIILIICGGYWYFDKKMNFIKTLSLNDKLKHLFAGLEDIPAKNELRKLIMNMMAEDPKERWTIDKCIEFFSETYFIYEEETDSDDEERSCPCCVIC